MNTYRVSFTARCGEGAELIPFSLVIESAEPVPVEHLVGEINRLAGAGGMSHEAMADHLYTRFRGSQWLVATHDRVTIETDRP